MSHFAKIENNLVVEVIVAEMEHISTLEGVWIRTSYNDNVRYNYAGVGYTYDDVNDVFIAPQPFPSWTITADFKWIPPVKYPNDGEVYEWNEDTKSWSNKILQKL